MTRRRLLLALTSLAAWFGSFGPPSGANAQQPVTPRRIGVLLGGFSANSKEAQQFRQGLLDAGYVEGRDLVIEWRSAGGDYTRMPALVADLIERKVDVIVITSTVGAQAAKRATSTIPIVMAVVADPIGSGLVADLVHPGGNLTGNTIMSPDLSAKRLQLLKEAVPRATRVAVLWNLDTPYSQKLIEELKVAAPSLLIELKFIAVHSPEEIDQVRSSLTRMHAQALYVVEAPLFAAQRPVLLKLASNARLPIAYWERRWPEEGGLMSYGPSLGDLFRRSAGYVDKILKGGKPGDLPIEQPTKFELVVNLKTANALGIRIPESILLRTDEIIR